MAAVFQKVEVEWQGKTYHINPTMRVINDIEQEISLARFASRLASGDAPMAHLATILSKLLVSAGAKASPELVYQELMHGTSEQIGAVASSVMEAVFPAAKKTDAPAKAKRQKT